MVKYGKLFRELQIKEFKGNYINYKKLKQKIKQIQEILPRTSQQLIRNRASNISNLKLRPTILSEKDDGDSYENLSDQYGEKVKEFKLLLDEEFQRSYSFFKKIRKQLHNKINRHLYTQTNYLSYNLEEFLKEVNNLRNTTYLAKCLNAFINDNMKAIKCILKKFDKKFFNYFGNIGPKYILDNLTKQYSELEFLLQFKIIDETSCICESNLKLLTEYFKEYCNLNKVDNNSKIDFEAKANKIFEYIKDIDELIYFKIQYKEWFYYTKKDASIISNSNLFKNLMFNPILFSAYHKDDLMNKFLSRKAQIKEVEQIQIPLSVTNKINITLIFIHTFFYNTLISGIYPLLFEFVGTTRDKDFIPYSLLIIASTYFFSYFSIMFYNCFGTHNIKVAYSISYFLFFIGSLSYILSDRNNKDNEGKDTLKNFLMIGFLLFSRIIIGLGANSTMGRKYVLSYASKYFLPFISKIYVIFSILGHSIGPLIGFILYDTNEKKILGFLFYSKYNCIGWYGLIMSFILLLIHLFLFTSPFSPRFNKLKDQKKRTHMGTMSSLDSPFFDDNIEDSQDKEFYKLQKEMKIKISSDNDFDSNKEIKHSYVDKDVNNLRQLSEINDNIDINNDEDLRSERKNRKDMNINKMFIKAGTLQGKDINTIEENIQFTNTYDINPLLISTNIEDIKDETQEQGSFTNINMIPRTIDDLVRKEKKTFGYLNKNLLIILIILFFDNLLKENFVGYCSYYFYYSIDFNKTSNNINLKYLSCLISLSYLLEIFSIPFILPFHKINTLIKKSLIILMVLTLLLMIPLSIDYVVGKYIIIYFIIISCVFLISSIIEVLSSCYLAYLTPPEWKFSQFNAGALPIYVMTFGKLCGCLICLSAFSGNLLLNHHIVIGLTLLGYGISGIFILKSKNFRIKAIARIMRKSELEQSFN